MGIATGRILHTAESLFHDHEPAIAAGLPNLLDPPPPCRGRFRRHDAAGERAERSISASPAWPNSPKPHSGRRCGAETPPPDAETGSMAGAPKLDRIDIAILARLQVDGRMTNAALADCGRTVAQPLPAAGAAAGGRGLHRRLRRTHRPVEADRDRDRLHRGDAERPPARGTSSASRPGWARSRNCWNATLVSGGYDYLLRFLTRSIAHYSR